MCHQNVLQWNHDRLVKADAQMPFKGIVCDFFSSSHLLEQIIVLNKYYTLTIKPIPKLSVDQLNQTT